LFKKIDSSHIEEEYNKISFLSNRLYYDYEVRELAKMIFISKKLKGYEKYLFLSLIRRAMIRKIPYSRMNVPWEQIVKLRDEKYSYEKYKRKTRLS
jgi:adenine-specific DNA-methyltransferase